jgi:hypothetical protein
LTKVKTFEKNYTINMKKYLTIVLVVFGLAAYGQQGKFNPFKLIVIKPDTAIIDKSLYGDIDSVQLDYQERYYKEINTMEEMLNSSNYPKGMEDEFKKTNEYLKKQIPLLKAMEPEIKKFRYYQTLSSYSAEVYNFYFNEYAPYSTIAELPNQNTSTAALAALADTAKADYIVFFSNIHTATKDGLAILKVTSSLFSKKDNKIILTKETEGDMNSRGFMWTCGGTTLSCLLINGVRTSTDAITPEIAKRQLKH